MIKRHTRKNQQNPQGAIVEREGSIHISNVMLASNMMNGRPAAELRSRRRQLTYEVRLYQKYIESVRPALIVEKRKYQNIHQVPHMEKIVSEHGSQCFAGKRGRGCAVKDLTMITAANR